MWEILKVELIKHKLYHFYLYVERQLVEIVAMMEINGCKVDNEHLRKASDIFQKKIESLESKIFNFVGENLMLVHLNN